MSTNQASRFIEIKTDLNNPAIRLRSFSGQEQMSRLFSYSLEIVCVSEELSYDDVISKLIGKPATIRLDTKEGERFYNGILTRVRLDYSEDGGTIYRAEMVPALWLLTRKANCRIFQEESPLDIICKILGEHNIVFTSSGCTASYPNREYCVQYRETDFNFVSRLMEQYGIGYFFSHEDGEHKLHLFDSADGYVTNEENCVSYYLTRQASQVFEDHISDWEHQYQFVSGKYAQTDYNFKEPSNDLMTEESTVIDQPDAPNYEIYDFPGEYIEKSVGKEETKIRMQEEEVGFNQVSGASTCRTFNVGGKFTIDKHASPSEEGKEYVIVGIQHSAVDPSVSGSAAMEYSNTFSCIPADVVFRPARVTPKPVISGLQTAVVVGPSGEEIFTDEYGRIKVSFFWDREGKDDGTDSIWLRCTHSVAGKKWGFFTLPRIGQEVVIDFLEGDPDRPVCVGGVYNAEQMPHYPLPDDMTKSYFKTNSTKGGDGFNEICFEDLSGKERFFVHAQKDMDFWTNNESRENICGNRHQTIGTEDNADSGNQTELLHGSKQQTIKKHHLEWVGGSRTTKIGGGDEDPGINDVWVEKKNRTYVGDEGDHLKVTGDSLIDVGGERGLTVGGDQKTDVTGGISTSAGGDIKIKGMNYHMESDMAVHAKGGMSVAIEGGQAVHVKGGMTLVLEGGMSVCLKCGGNFINVTTAGIFIQGTLVGINSGGAATSGSGCSPQSPDSPTAPEEAPEAAPAEPDVAHNEKTGHASNS